MAPLADSITHGILKTALGLSQGNHFRHMLRAAENPKEAQHAALGKILAANAETEFGRRHGFSKVGAIDEFRRAVPVQTYESLRHFVERQEIAGEQCLTREPPIYFHRTSGTAGAPKDIPVTSSGLQRIKHYQRMFSYAVARGSRALGGKIFGITGQAVEGTMPGGTPFGSASGLLYQSHSRFLRSRYVLPPELSDITDYQARYLAMAVYGLSEPSVTCLGTANPSTLLRLLSLINEQPDVVLRAVADGRLPDSVSATHVSNGTLRPNGRRAAHLEKQFGNTGKLTYGDIWPNLKAVLTWTGGSCGVPLRSLSPLLPPDAKIIEIGYVASEVQGTINIDIQRNDCLPTFLDTVFEFAERDRWDGGEGSFLSLHELEVGHEYYVFVTTPDGLYRYDINDIVRVSGRVNETPTLQFVQKGKGVTSITGEKLYEKQVLDAVTSVLTEQRLQSLFFVMLADQGKAAYTLYVEAGSGGHVDLSADLDRRLGSLNIEYEGKRSSGRLAPLKVCWLRDGTGDAYRSNRVAAGQRDAQFKYLHLQYAHECAFDFDLFSLPGHP